MQTGIDVVAQRKPARGNVVKYDDHSLTLADNTSFAEWQEAVKVLGKLERGIQFWIGDALNFGADRFGEEFAQAIDDANARTWVNYAWVARQVHKSLRNDALMWSHYVAIAPLSREEQIDMIGKIQKDKMNARDTQKAVRKLKGNPPLPKPRKWERCLVVGKVPLEMAGQNYTDYVVRVHDMNADKHLFPDGLHITKIVTLIECPSGTEARTDG